MPCPSVGQPSQHPRGTGRDSHPLPPPDSARACRGRVPTGHSLFFFSCLVKLGLRTDAEEWRPVCPATLPFTARLSQAVEAEN